MKIWIVAAHDHIYGVDTADRALRYTVLTEVLLARGHEVRIWSSSFHHGRKQQRTAAGSLLNPEAKYFVELLRGRSYRKNVSLRRILHNREIAKEFLIRSKRAEKPDLILLSIPSLELGSAACDYARRHCVSLITDVVDIWPEVYLLPFPLWTHGFARLLLLGEFRRARAIFSWSQQVLAVSKEYLDWACLLGKRPADSTKVFYLGYPSISEADLRLAGSREEKLRQQYNIPNASRIIAFLGTFGRTYDVETMLAAACVLRNRRDIHFFLAGAGDKFAQAKRDAATWENVSLPGWMGADQSSTLLASANLGLSAYAARAPQSLPYKPFEYMSFGLPQISSLKGELRQILEQHDLGVYYPAGNAKELSEAILKLLREQNLVGRREQILKKYHENFDSRLISAKLASLLENEGFRSS